MRLWATTRRPLLIAACAGAFAVSTILVGNREVPALSLTSAAMLSVPLAVYLPLMLSVGAVVALNNVPSELEVAAVRRVARYDALSMVAVLFATAGVMLTTARLTGQALPLQAIRNAVMYVSLSMIALSCVGPALAGLAPTVFAIGSATFGWGTARRPAAWALPLQRGTSIEVGAATIGLLLFAVAIYGIRGRARHPRSAFGT